MSEMKRYFIDSKNIIRDKSSSDGSQIKYYQDGRWYKIDNFGGEAESECLASTVLSFTNLEIDKYVCYEKAIINDKVGCVSIDFRRDEEEEFITLYRLYKNIHGRDLAGVTSKMDYDDAIMYVIDFVREQTGLNITTYLANTFWLDALIINTDRHFNNLGIIMRGDEYREAPIFDNGKSLLTGVGLNNKSLTIGERVKEAYAKAFSPDFDLNFAALKEYCTIELDKEGLIRKLDGCDDTLQKQVLLYRLER